MSKNKTLLVAPMYLDEGDRYERNVKWLNYVIPLQEKLGFNSILLLDNRSVRLNEFLRQMPKTNFIKVYKFDEHLSRTAHTEYPYWYRAFGYAARYARENAYSKIIHIDTDVYLLNDKICEFVKNIDSGWNTFWCPRHNFPESTFQVIGFDQLEKFEAFMSKNPIHYYGHDAENLLPFTHIHKQFKGDRYGEIRASQTSDMDYYCQAPVDIELIFNMDDWDACECDDSPDHQYVCKLHDKALK